MISSLGPILDSSSGWTNSPRLGIIDYQSLDQDLALAYGERVCRGLAYWFAEPWANYGHSFGLTNTSTGWQLSIGPSLSQLSALTNPTCNILILLFLKKHLVLWHIFIGSLFQLIIPKTLHPYGVVKFHFIMTSTLVRNQLKQFWFLECI